MADEEKEGNVAGAREPARAGGSRLIVLALVMVVTLVVSAGGAVFWLMKSGRLPLQAGASQPVSAAKTDPPRTRMLLLDPLLVNLADAGGAGYLRVAMVLRIEEPVKAAKPAEEKPAEKGKTALSEDEARIRDAALTVLGQETSDRLLAPEGKGRVKDELRKAFAMQVPEVKVTEILYTEFLVQR